LPYSLVVSSAITFAAFWCACNVKGTVRAALCVFPALGLVLGASGAGFSVAQSLVLSDLLPSALLRFHPFPFGKAATFIVDRTIWRYAIFWVLVAPLALALIQTRRLFRQEISDSVLSAVRYLLPVVVVAFFFSFASLLPFVVIHSASRAIFQTLYETHAAVGKMQTDIGKASKTQPQLIAPEDLSKVAPLSNTAQTLLRGSMITIRPKEADPHWLEIHKQHSEYFTTIRFRNDWECTAYGGPYVHCKTSTGDSLGITPP
jgi:hypothetical protein